MFSFLTISTIKGYFSLKLIMSQSTQMSDAGSSSLFNIDDSDSLSGLQSDNQHLHIPDILHRQQSINLTSDLDILPVLLPPCPPAPSSLQRIKPDRKSSYILYLDMTKSEFVAWWLKKL
ncbi:hypothetical protein BDW66DRAFT_145603 [Aspergillus desertorum]